MQTYRITPPTTFPNVTPFIVTFDGEMYHFSDETSDFLPTSCTNANFQILQNNLGCKVELISETYDFKEELNNSMIAESSITADNHITAKIMATKMRKSNASTLYLSQFKKIKYFKVYNRQWHSHA
jgi:hypothetical protein